MNEPLLTSPLLPDTQPVVNRENPWPGLSPFDEDTAAFFFGRKAETAELESLVNRATLSVVYGQSGLGKTSLLRAGLTPCLRHADFLTLYLRLDHAEGAPSLTQQVKDALTCALAAAQVDARPPNSAETLWEYFHETGLDFWSSRNRRLIPVMMFDQFEELFTIGRQTAAQQRRGDAFLDELACLITGRAPQAVQNRLDAAPEIAAAFDYEKTPVKILLSLREDFLPDFETLRERCRWNAQNRFRLRRMTGDQAWEAVSKPGAGLLDETVTAQIVDFVSSSRKERGDVVHTRSELARREIEPALLSVVCRELNNRRLKLKQPAITADLLSGSRDEIIRDFYERALADHAQGVRMFVEDELLTGSGFRKRAALDDALKAPGMTAEAVRSLVNRRLLRQEEAGGVIWLELTHDLLTDVAQASRAERQEREALAAAATREKRIHDELVETRKRSRQIITAVGVGLVLALILAGVSFAFYRQATQAEEAARKARIQAENLIEFMVFDLRDILQPLGRLDLLASVNQRVAAYYRSFESALTEPETLRRECAFLDNQGDVQQALGDSSAALGSYRESLAIGERLVALEPQNAKWQQYLSASHLKIGGAQYAQGNCNQALQSYRGSLAIGEKVAAQDPTNADWQADLSYTFDGIGNVQQAQGNIPAALQSYRDGLAIREKLAALDATSPKWQHALSVSYVNIGDVQQAQGNLVAALQSYRDGLAIREKLAAWEPMNAEWQGDLSSSFDQIGGVQQAQGNLTAALQSYRGALAIRQKLASQDPKNADWQRNLGLSYTSIGSAQLAQADLVGAMRAYQDRLAIVETLVAQDPKNLLWQRDLSDSYYNVGLVQQSQGNLAGAAKSYRDSFGIMEKMVTHDPDNATWRRNLSYCQMALGLAAQAQGDLTGALQSYRVSLAIHEKLLAQDPIDANRQMDLSHCYLYIATVQQDQGDLAGALHNYRECVAIREKLASRDSQNMDWQRQLAWGYSRLGSLFQSQGEFEETMTCLRRSAGIREKLVAKDPKNADWQLDLTADHLSIGQILLNQGDIAGATKMFQDELTICEQHTRLDPDNANWQRQAAAYLENLGEVINKGGDRKKALKYFQDSLAIADKWVTQDSLNVDWQHIVVVCHDRIGNCLAHLDNRAEAQACFRKALAIRRELTQKTRTPGHMSDLGCLLLKVNEIEPASAAISAGLKLAPDNVELNCALADVYMFSGEEAKAVELHRRYRERRTSDGWLWAETVADTFAIYRKLGLEHPQMKEIEALLGIETSRPERGKHP